jgi:hypothetical protein
MQTFARFFAITFGIVLGMVAAVIVVGVVAFGGYSLYTADQDRRANQARATATTRLVEDRQRQDAAIATHQAAQRAARQCEDPQKLTVSAMLEVPRARNSIGVFVYQVSGVVRNTCNYDIVFNLELTGLAENVSSIIVTRVIGINEEGNATSANNQTTIRAGQERLFRAHLTDRGQPDVASVRITPIVIAEGYPF